VAERSGDTAFGRKIDPLTLEDFCACASGVALRLPPQSEKLRHAEFGLITETDGNTVGEIMGAFYGNITFKGSTQLAVAEALRGSRAIVAPETGCYVVAFSSACDDQDIEAIQTNGSQLSRKLQCSFFAVVVHDDDVLVYFLYENGDMADWYSSSPNYFDFGSAKKAPGPVGGNAERLCAAFGLNNKDEIESILRKRRGKSGYVFETRRHEDLVRALGLPKFTVGKALASFERGEYPDGLSESQMLRTADAPSVEDDRQQRRDREFYDKLGPEDSTRKCKHEGCHRGVVRFSVLCRRHHFEMIEHRDCPFDD
jgi:hypothetical protein